MEKLQLRIWAYIRPFMHIGLYNGSLLALALIGSCYVLFLQESPHLNLYWVLAFPFFFLLAEWKAATAHGAYIAWTLCLLLLLCVIKLDIYSKEILLSGIMPEITAGLISYAVTATFVWYFTRKAPASESLQSWRFSLTILIGSLAIFYFLSVLKSINCLLDPMQSAVYCQTTVCQKCPPYNGFALCLHYTYQGKHGSTLLEVSEGLYFRVKEGDTITLRLHPGVLGWPWYHPGIGFRKMK